MAEMPDAVICDLDDLGSNDARDCAPRSTLDYGRPQGVERARARKGKAQGGSLAQGTLRGVKAPTELGRVVVRAGQLCAGVDMY